MFDWLRRRPKATSASRFQISADRAFDAVERLGELMVRHPTAILDTKQLPLPKDDMKAVLKLAWQITRDDNLRNHIEVAFVRLSNFQDGVGDQPIDCVLPPGCTPEQARSILDPYVARSERMKAEGEVLLAELREFKRSVVAE